MAMYQKECLECGRAFVAKSDLAKFCRTTCRVKHHRDRKPAVVDGPDGPTPPTHPTQPKVVQLRSLPALPSAEELAEARDDDGPVLKATRAELDAAHLLSTSAGQVALVVAWRLDHSNMETGSSLASMVKAHQLAMAAALSGAPKKSEGDTLDGLRELKARVEGMVAG